MPPLISMRTHGHSLVYSLCCCVHLLIAEIPTSVSLDACVALATSMFNPFSLTDEVKSSVCSVSQRGLSLKPLLINRTLSGDGQNVKFILFLRGTN